jgi:hypothetical protein
MALMAAKYDRLRTFLEDCGDDEPISLTFEELDGLVDGLPPSAGGRTWWANTTNATRVQAHAWLGAGRRVSEVRLGKAVVFSPVDATPDLSSRPTSAERVRRRTRPILDGVAALADVLARAGYVTVAEGVAAHTLFLHPDTVAQAGRDALFRIVRDPSRRGSFGQLPDGTDVMFDDNTSPKLAFLWAAQCSTGPDVQYNHVWSDPRNPATYTALWNLCATPAFLAKTTDGSNHPDVLALLRFRAYELFGRWPDGEQEPPVPVGYDQLRWPDPPEPVDDLEAILRQRLADAPKSRPSRAARRLGWAFSDWQPDVGLLDSAG